MRGPATKLSMRVTLSRAKDLTQARLIAPKKRRDANFVSAVPHFVRDDARSARGRVLFTSS